MVTEILDLAVYFETHATSFVIIGVTSLIIYLKLRAVMSEDTKKIIEKIDELDKKICGEYKDGKGGFLNDVKNGCFERIDNNCKLTNARIDKLSTVNKLIVQFLEKQLNEVGIIVRDLQNKGRYRNYPVSDNNFDNTLGKKINDIFSEDEDENDK